MKFTEDYLFEMHDQFRPEAVPTMIVAEQLGDLTKAVKGVTEALLEIAAHIKRLEETIDLQE